LLSKIDLKNHPELYRYALIVHRHRTSLMYAHLKSPWGGRDCGRSSQIATRPITSPLVQLSPQGCRPQTKVCIALFLVLNSSTYLRPFRVNNFSRDVADGENYTILLNQLKPNECSRAPLQERDLLKRAELVSCLITPFTFLV
jgi:hypothetical protein